MTNCAPSLALALLLHATASPPAAFQEALLQPYAGYCAHPPLAQQGAIAGPLADEILSRAHIHLVGVQVVFRHGARDLSSDRACFATMEAVFRNCSVQQLVSFETGEKEKEETPALLRKMMDAYPSMEENMPGSGYISQAVGCGKGVLLNDAIPQTIALAHSIEQKYFRSLPSAPSLDTIRMYSTGKERTQATLFLLQKHLFRDESAKARSFYSRPVSSDPWDLNQHCPRVGHMRHARHFQTDPQIIERRFPSFARRWRDVAGTEFQASFKDCLLVAQCSGQQALLLPEGLQPNSELFKEALTISLELFQEHFSKDDATVEQMQLLAAPALLELDQLLQHQADETDSAAFALWATHDTTILVMLVALGLWDGQWPPYTDTLVLEVYKELKQQGSQRGGRAFVRLLHGSTVLHLPWCKVHETIPGLCSVESFLPPAIERFRDMKAYRRACNASNLFSATPAFPVEQSVTCGLPSAGVLMFSVLSFVAGCQFKAWQRSRPDSEADYVVLSPQPP